MFRRRIRQEIKSTFAGLSVLRRESWGSVKRAAHNPLRRSRCANLVPMRPAEHHRLVPTARRYHRQLDPTVATTLFDASTQSSHYRKTNIRQTKVLGSVSGRSLMQAIAGDSSS